MADKISKEKRSANMSKIKGSNTLIEIGFRKQLYKLGIRYSLKYKLFGKPDLAITSKKIAIFINGCFWQGTMGKLATRVDEGYHQAVECADWYLNRCLNGDDPQQLVTRRTPPERPALK